MSDETAPDKAREAHNAKRITFKNVARYALYVSRILSGEEGEDDARSACPSDTLGYTHNTMVITTRSDGATLS